MHDFVRQTAASHGVIFHEEVARDGAQGKTLLDAEQRANVARRHSALLGPSAHRNLVFMAGFPSAGPEEYRAVRHVVSEIDTCYVGAAGRLLRDDIDLMASALAGARYGRMVLVVPVSEQICGVLMRREPRACLTAAVEAVRYAVDKAPDIVVDVALVDAARADLGFVAEAATALTQAGASMAILCDTVGGLYPSEARAFFAGVTAAKPDAVFVAHMHNDLGFGLINTLEALSNGIFGLTSSWLGLGERSGMPATEQLLFALGHEPERLAERLGVDERIWLEKPDLKGIVPLAQYISEAIDFQLRSTDPIVGSGVNSISTGTPFTNPNAFSPFDPEAVLGTPRKVLLTPLASLAIVATVARSLGFELAGPQLSAALSWVKSHAHAHRMAIVPETDFASWLNGAVATSLA
jgi:2-isopropylmalate synthase